MKSATTSLHEYLNTHPHIAMSRLKEPAFFVEEFTLRLGEQWYLSLFDNDERYRYRGESSTYYARLPIYQGVAERIYRFNPDARLIYIMRNPFDRVLSHYWHNVHRLNPYVGLNDIAGNPIEHAPPQQREIARITHARRTVGEPRPLLKAVMEDPQYLAFSDYATQLEPYIDRFGKDSLYTLTFESLVQDPQREVDRLYHWLGLSEHPLPDQSTYPRNRAPNDMSGAAGAGILYRIRFSRTWDRIAPYFPVRMKQFAKKRAYRPVDRRRLQESVAHLRAEISDLQRHQVARLSRLLDREFPEWQL